MYLLRYLGWMVSFCSLASAQVITASSIGGEYFVRHIEFTTDNSNNVTDARSIIGSMTMDGIGTYSFTGQQVIGTGAAAQYNANGTYTVSPAGFVTLTNPQRNTFSINARFGTEALVGSGTETAGNTFDLFVAIPAPLPNQTNASVQSGWAATDFELTGASAAQARTSFLAMTLDGAGSISSLNLNGHAANFNSGGSVDQSIFNGAYNIKSDGSGSIAFPLPPGVSGAGAMMSATARTFYCSKSGNMLLAGTPGAHDIFVAVRKPTSSVTLSNGQRFWNAGIRIDSSGSGDSYTGSSTVITQDNAFINSRRLHETGSAAFNWTVSFLYTVASDGTGSVGAEKLAVGQGGNFIGASVGSPLDPTGFEIIVAVSIPPVSGSGVFLNPQGIVNSATNAPAGDAISPGEFITIYGSGLAGASAQAQTLPFPSSIGGVSVSINNVNAPIYFVSSGQINCLVPYEAAGQSATIVATNNGAKSNPVTVGLARTSPGVFTIDGSGTSDGAITHADGSLVNSSNPAVKGETVIVYVSGLGSLTTSVSDGFGASGLNNATTQLAVYVAGIPAPGVIYQGLTIEPGLYQINFQIPTTLVVGGELPVAIQTPDAFNDTANIAVR
jgi:uncharacterized protein (TIGR03437 family)